jgi:hypothetical protein
MISERLRKLRSAASTCANCAGCGHVFESDESVWRVRVRTGAGFFGGSMIIAPFCRQCLKPYWRPVVSSGRCEGCSRMVHNTEGYREHIYCSEVCATKCEVRRHSGIARERRAEARGSTRVCVECGEHFEPARADVRFCSGVCKQRAYRKRVTLSKKDKCYLFESRNADGCKSDATASASDARSAGPVHERGRGRENAPVASCGRILAFLVKQLKRPSRRRNSACA